MKNIYDEEVFFEKYSEMLRSKKGLDGAGEWHDFQAMFPDLKGKRVLDLGCGYGWHCNYAVKQGAISVLGIDLSKKMLEKANQINSDERITYQLCGIEEYEYPKDTFDTVISSLALHYVEDFEEVCRKVFSTLKKGGDFIFSIEHPIFTAYGSQDWLYDENGEIVCWPVDRYFTEGSREAVFLGEKTQKQHRTLTTLLNGLLACGFVITGIKEPQPSSELKNLEEMKNEFRRPMMLLVSVHKN